MAPVACDDRLQDALPIVGAVHVPTPKRTAFEIAELVEDKQRMIARAAEVSVPNALLLLAVGRAHARIHVQHDLLR